MSATRLRVGRTCAPGVPETKAHAIPLAGRRHVPFFCGIEIGGHAGLDLVEQIVDVCHDHAHAARTCAATNRTWKRRPVDPQLSVAVADKKIKRPRSKGVSWARVHAICELRIDFRLAFDHGWRGGPTRPLCLAPDCICSGFVKTVPANSDAVAHRRAVSLNVIEIPRNRVDMDIAWHQPGTRFDAGRKEARMQSPWVGRGRVIA